MSALEDYDKVLKRFMPAFKSSAANIMAKEYGMTQQRAAVLLGVTQAAISKYINEGQKCYPGVKIDEKVVKAFVERVNVKDLKGGQRLMCKMCQDNVKFNCAFMV
jgi:predicted transcriptional regulator